MVKRLSIFATSWENSASISWRRTTQSPRPACGRGPNSLPVGPPRFAHPARAGRTSAGSSIAFSRVRSRRALTGATRDWLMRQRMYRQRFAVRLGRCCQWSVGRRRSQHARRSLGVPIRSRPVLPHRLCVMSLCSQPTTPEQERQTRRTSYKRNCKRLMSVSSVWMSERACGASAMQGGDQ